MAVVFLENGEQYRALQGGVIGTPSGRFRAGWSRVRSRALTCALLGMALSACSAGGDESRDRVEIHAGEWAVTAIHPSPDGEHIAFMGRRQTLGLTHLVLAGDDPVVLGPPGTNARSFAWMPEGDRILLAYGEEIGTTFPSRFAVVDLEGRVVREFPIGEDLNATYGLAVSPDGRRAVFPAVDAGPSEGEGDLWSLDLESGRFEVLELRGADPGVQQYPVFIDDDRVAFGAGELSWEFGGPNGWIAVLDLRTHEVLRLTEPSQTALTPSVSPDGEFIVYDAFPGNERSGRGLWYVPADGSAAPRRLLEELPGRLPALHPSGRSVFVIDAGMPGDRTRGRSVEVSDEAPWLSD